MHLLSNTASQSTNNARNEYKYHTIFVLVSFPRPRELLNTQASQNFGETKTLDNKSLIRHFSVQYRCKFLLIICILTCPSGSPKYCMTHKNIQRYYTLKCLIRYSLCQSSLQRFCRCVLKLKKVLRIQIILKLTVRKVGYKNVLQRHWTATRSRKKNEKAVSVLENDSEKILKKSQLAVQQD